MVSSWTRSRFGIVLAGALLGVAVGCAGGEPYNPIGGPAGGTGVGSGGGGIGSGGSGMGPTGGNGGSGGSSTGSGGNIVNGTGGRTGSGGRAGTGGSTGTGGTAVAAPSGTVLLLDTFDGGPVGLYSWYPADAIGTWMVAMDGASKAMQETVVGSLSLNVGGDVAWTDVIVEAKVNFKTFTSTSAIVYLAVRLVDTKNYYFLEFHADGSMKVRRKVAGSSTDLLSYKSQVPVVMGTLYTIAFGIKGSTVTAYLNGTAVMSFTDTVVLPAGGIALGTQQVAASFDDVKVTAP